MYVEIEMAGTKKLDRNKLIVYVSVIRIQVVVETKGGGPGYQQ
jgi:hypothetical protein